MKGIVIIMNEYNNGFENNENSVNEVKPPKKHTGTKIVASLMAMVLVSGGSIAAYRAVDSKFSLSGSGASVSEEKEAATENKDDSEKSERSEQDKSENKLTADTVSIIEPNESKNGVLTTEEVVEKCLPSVVGIESKFEISGSTSNGYDFGGFGGFGFGGFGDFGGFNYGGGDNSTREATATGTGVVITDNGYVVTNAHVIYDSEYGGGEAKEISVLLNDEKSYDAELIGYDTDCDLAVLKIDAKGLTAAEFGDSDKLKLGESVVAIGNPLGFELMDTVTSGIVSGLNRNITINDKPMNLLQTDAAINSGNSGGPLINKYGQVIGINSSKMSSSYSSNSASIEGIGFAIPSNDVSRIVDDIMQFGYVTGKPQLGISCQDVTETIANMYNLPVGVYVTAVTEGSAAEKAGLRTGDVITKIDGEDVATAEELTAKKNEHEAGDTIKITYVRSGKTEHVKVTLDEAS